MFTFDLFSVSSAASEGKQTPVIPMVVSICLLFYGHFSYWFDKNTAWILFRTLWFLDRSLWLCNKHLFNVIYYLLISVDVFFNSVLFSVVSKFRFSWLVWSESKQKQAGTKLNYAGVLSVNHSEAERCQHKEALMVRPAAPRTLGTTRYVTPFDFCFVNKWHREKLTNSVPRSHQTAPNKARTGRRWAEALSLLTEKRPPTNTTPTLLSSINSLHVGQQPGILHIPEPKLLEVYFKQQQRKRKCMWLKHRDVIKMCETENSSVLDLSWTSAG